MGPGWSLAVAILLAGSAMLPVPVPIFCALAAIIALGVPHGALDGEIARTVLRPRFKRAWFPVFAMPYLALVAFVLLAWHAAPLVTLALFLAASVWHFGSEDGASLPLVGKLVAGGLPIAVPVVVHPEATVRIFVAIAGVPLAAPPAWLTAGAIVWIALAATWTVQVAARRRPRLLLRPLVLVGAFVALPPLTAFAIYFVCVHAPAHTAALIAHPSRAVRVHDRRSAWLRALPLASLAVLIGVLLWPLYAGTAPDRLLSVTIQGLAALTLPHMLFDAWLSRRERLNVRASGPASRRPDLVLDLP